MHRYFVALTLALAISFGWMLPEVGAQAGDAAGHPLIGSWLVEVNIEGDPPLALPNLASFTSDGVVVVAAPTLLPELPGETARTLFSAGHGAWSPSGEDTAAVRFAFLVVDEQGQPDSINVIFGELQVGEDGDSYTGTFTLMIETNDPESSSETTGTWQASRITAESGLVPPRDADSAATPAP